MKRSRSTVLTSALSALTALPILVGCGGNESDLREGRALSTSSLDGDAILNKQCGSSNPAQKGRLHPNEPTIGCFVGQSATGFTWQRVETVTVYRRYNRMSSDHLFTTVSNEGDPSYVTEGVPFFLLKVNPGGDSARLYRCFSGSSHFLSLDAGCEGHANEGALGFLATQAFASYGVSDLRRCRSPKTSDHITTLDPNECQSAGYVVEGGQGLALRPGGRG